MVPLLDHATLASGVAVSSTWRVAFAPRLDSLLDRLAAAVEKLQSDDPLRRLKLLRERRSTLRSSLPGTEAMETIVASLRGFGGGFMLSDAAREEMLPLMRVTSALASTVLAATDNPGALSHVPSALVVGNVWWVVSHGNMFICEALKHVDDCIERCVPWSSLVESEAWRAIIQAASATHWFVNEALSAEHAEESPDMNALAKWAVALMDEAGVMYSEPEARAADAELREIVRVRDMLNGRRVRPSRTRQRHRFSPFLSSWPHPQL